MGYETEIINEKECGCHTIKRSHDFFNDTSYDEVYCTVHEASNNDTIKLTNLQRVKQWKKENPDKLALQKHRRYVWLKESRRLRSILL